MASVSFKAELLAEVERLEAGDQRRVLEFARSLAGPRPTGTPGPEFVKRALAVKITASDLDEMSRAVEEDCERIDVDGW